METFLLELFLALHPSAGFIMRTRLHQMEVFQEEMYNPFVLFYIMPDGYYHSHIIAIIEFNFYFFILTWNKLTRKLQIQKLRLRQRKAWHPRAIHAEYLCGSCSWIIYLPFFFLFWAS